MPTRFPFTKRSIEALPRHDPNSPSREAEYSDSEMIGLKLRVSKNGRRFFQHRYSYMGRKRCLALGEFPHVSVHEAAVTTAVVTVGGTVYFYSDKDGDSEKSDG